MVLRFPRIINLISFVRSNEKIKSNQEKTFLYPKRNFFHLDIFENPFDSEKLDRDFAERFKQQLKNFDRKLPDADIIFHAGEEKDEVLYTRCARPDGMRFHAGAVN